MADRTPFVITTSDGDARLSYAYPLMIIKRCKVLSFPVVLSAHYITLTLPPPIKIDLSFQLAWHTIYTGSYVAVVGQPLSTLLSMAEIYFAFDVDDNDLLVTLLTTILADDEVLTNVNAIARYQRIITRLAS